METYKLNMNFHSFVKDFEKNIGVANRSTNEVIGFLHNGDTMYLRCSNQLILDRIKNVYDMELVDATEVPSFFAREGWAAGGAYEFFTEL